MKEMSLSEFKEYVKEHDGNTVGGGGIAGMFSKEKPDGFAIVCKKCGSMNVEIIGEDGADYGGQTGYSPGSNVIKCNNCGNAITEYI